MYIKGGKLENLEEGVAVELGSAGNVIIVYADFDASPNVEKNLPSVR